MSRSSQIPDDLLKDPVLNRRIQQLLPENYSFEIHKTIWRIRKDQATKVCLQFPDGLFIFAVPIVDILSEFLPNVEFIIMADVVYGACCIDDIKAKELGCQLIVHYGHSCLVPINRMSSGISVLYIFVDIKFDLLHFIQSVVKNFDPTQHKICLASTIQFVASAHIATKELRDKYNFEVFLPQSRPLTPGEILGCTAPTLKPDQANTIVFIADGRFHLEALMIANPKLPAFRYDPYNKMLTQEYYDHDEMIKQRQKAIELTKQVLSDGKPVGIIVGTLGRQGSMRVMEALKKLVRKSGSKSLLLTFMISEITPSILEELGGDTIHCWIQIGCPRLSIDWGNNFISKPLLSPFEFRMAVKDLRIENGKYPMDFYANSSLGPWTPNHKCHDQCCCEKV